jgi:DNA-binding IclR family transcriptional regulator
VSTSLTKALRILVVLGEGPASLDELATALEVHKTTVLRLLRTLADEHFVHRDDHHRYRLGSRLFELSSRGLDQREVRTVAAPHLHAFNRAHGHTVHLSERDDGEIVYIDKLESLDNVRMASRVGLRGPVHSTAAGKVLLADLPAAERNRVLDDVDFPARTPHTITDRDAYLAELARVREQGWAQDREENEASINCIGAPVRGPAGTAVAAVSGVRADHRRRLRPADGAGPVTAGRHRDDLPRPSAGARPERIPPHDHRRQRHRDHHRRTRPRAHLQPGRAQGRPAAGLRAGPDGPGDEAVHRAGRRARPDAAGPWRTSARSWRRAAPSVGDVLMFRVYLTEREHFSAMNDAYGEFVSRHVPDGAALPARTTVFVGLPHAEMLVEIDALAAPAA